MNRATLLALAVLAGVPVIANAQTATQSSGSDKATQGSADQVLIQRALLLAPSKSTMYEDIEIMRRILLRELRGHQQADCAACHAVPVTLSSDGRPYDQLWTELGELVQLESSKPVEQGIRLLPSESGADGARFFPNVGPALIARAPAQNRNVHAGLGNIDIDGAYIADYGVVFHVAMPAMGAVSSGTPKLAVFSANAADDWDRVRKEVRGDAPDKPKNPGKQKPVDVADVLLKVMADNGRHFSKLGGNEKMTIIVNFRPALNPHVNVGRSVISESSQTLDPRRMGSSSSPQGNSTASQLVMASQLVSGSNTTGAPLASQSTSEPRSNRGFMPTSDFELLGDLQVKQGKVEEAIQAYEKAVEAQTDATRKSSLYRKLAEAYLKSSGKSDAVTKAIDYLQRAQKNVAPPTPERSNDAGKKDGEPQASKLIITASKSLLDAAKNMSPDEFRKAVHVERIAGSANQATPGKMVSPSGKTIAPVR